MNDRLLEYISINSKYVSINKNEIKKFATIISNYKYEYWLGHMKKYFSEKECILYVFLCESINFCFWNSEINDDIDKEKYSGSKLIFKLIEEKAKNDLSFLNIASLINISEKEFISLLRQGFKKISLEHERYILFMNTVKTIYQKKDNFFGEIFAIKTDLDLLNYIIVNFEYFRDTSYYDDLKVDFNKRATLLVNDLFNISKTINDNIGNVNNLKGCADYEVPRILFDNNIISYNDTLLKKIKSMEQIEHNDIMEIEIRANTLYAIELIKKEVLENNKKISSVELDNIIWNMKNGKILGIPAHRTVTIYY